MSPLKYSILTLPASDECVARVEPPTRSHFKHHYLKAQNAGFDYLAGSILVLWMQAFPEDWEGDVPESDDFGPQFSSDPVYRRQAYTEAGNECMSAWERNQ